MLDTKLKNNKKYINKILIRLAIGIILIPVLGWVAKKYIPTNGFYEKEVVQSYIYECYFDIQEFLRLTDGLDGVPSETAINDEVVNIKANYKNEYEYKKDIVADAVDYGYEEWQYENSLKEFKDAEVNYNKSDEVIREEAISGIKWNIENIKSKRTWKNNIELYAETKDSDKPITNIPSMSKDGFKDQTLESYDDYILVYGKDNSKRCDVSESFMPFQESIMLQNRDYDFYLRIAKPLEEGDAIAWEYNQYNKSKLIGFTALGLLILDIILIFVILIRIKKSNRTIKEGRLIKLYRKLFLELRIVVVTALIILMIGIHSIIWWEPFAYVIPLIIVGVILCYLILADLFKFKELYKNKELTEYYKKKLATTKLYSLIKESTMIKSTAVRVVSSIVVLIAYIIVIAYTGMCLTYSGIYNNIETLAVSTIAFIMTAILILYILKTGQQINKIKIGTDNIVKGNYNNQIDIKGPQVLKDISANVINIEAGLSTAVENAVRSEKMKGELITNVSHDLKTPLTSIINYVDLLDKENVSEEDKEKYIAVLKEKSARLKALIEDLFEASKAASGAMELNMESIDPVALLRQTIGEFEDKIEASGLSFIKRIPEEKLMVYADGRKTFRIFQNLISNILKYSMPNSRVYIEVKEDENKIEIAFKNISEHELDFTEEEILERFKRGDSSRTTEGSGLGLAIAKSLVELQGGSFKLSIDGDLFKATVSLRKGNLEIN